jgi:hypothetical protein
VRLTPLNDERSIRQNKHMMTRDCGATEDSIH